MNIFCELDRYMISLYLLLTIPEICNFIRFVVKVTSQNICFTLRLVTLTARLHEHNVRWWADFTGSVHNPQDRVILPASGTEPPQHIRHDLKQTKGTEHHERQQVRQPAVRSRIFNTRVWGASEPGLYRGLARQEKRQPERFLETGEKYYFGEGADQDYAEAVKWFLKAAEFGTDALRDGMRS